MTLVMDRYDAALFDLDGVVYLGPVAVEGAVEGFADLRKYGADIAFVTNNAARPPQTVVDQLVGFGIEAKPEDVVTSAQACARMVAEELQPQAKILIAGTQALANEIASKGFTIVTSADDNPDAVVQGYNPDMPWSVFDEAAIAIQQGAVWYITNTDSTRPTARGLIPGMGTQVNVVRVPTKAEPHSIAGKPYAPLLNETVLRLGCQAPIFVGDRIDTDIMGAVAVGMDSLFVFTGVHGCHDLLEADETGRPTHIGWNLQALLEPERICHVASREAICNGQRAFVDNGVIRFDVLPDERNRQLDLLWAILQLAWADPSLDGSVVSQLTQLH